MATREQVESAFYCASKGYRIPLQYALLQRAVSDYHNGDSRQSVINACAAAEVSLSAAVRKALSSAKVEDEAAGRIITRASGVVEMFRLFIVSGGKTAVSDNRVMAQLAGPRNAAAHDACRLQVLTFSELSTPHKRLWEMQRLCQSLLMPSALLGSLTLRIYTHGHSQAQGRPISFAADGSSRIILGWETLLDITNTSAAKTSDS
jgi:hypothetical protein